MEKLIIIVVICGVEVIKEYNFVVFYIVEEIVREVELVYKVGVSIIYLYVREDDGILI